MNNDVHLVLEASKTLNSQTISLTRCNILALLSYFVDGIQYRELKAALHISDGKLISNLNYLKLMGYVEKSEIELDRKKLDVYTISEKGKKELGKIRNWMRFVDKVTEESDKKCQVILTN